MRRAGALRRTTINQNTHSCVDNIQAENKMARAVHRSGLVALGIATALMASCAFAAKNVVVAVGSNFTTLDPYDAMTRYLRP